MVLKFGVYLELIVQHARKNSAFLFEEIHRNNIADKSQIRYLNLLCALPQDFSLSQVSDKVVMVIC